MAKGKYVTLPPKHGGYRAVENGGRKSPTLNKGYRLPKPPAGSGGGSKSSKSVS